MIEEFSGGYYGAMMDIQSYEDGPAIEQGLYTFIKNELFVTPCPVTIRLGFDDTVVFDVGAESAIPRDVLALPEDYITDDGTQYVLIEKAEYENIRG